MVAPVVNLSVLGDKELMRALAALEPRVQKKLTRGGLRRAYKVVLEAARRNARALSRPGNKTRRMRAVAAKMKLRSLKRSRGRIGVQVILPTKAELGIPESAKGYFPAHVELGTRKTRALPYLRPAHDANKDRVLQTVAQEIRQGIDQAWRTGR